MSDGYPASPVERSGGSPAAAPLRRDSGAVLRDVAVHREPRVLPSPAMRRAQASSEASSHVDVLEVDGGNGNGLELAGGDGYRAQADAAAAYQKGYQAGRSDAEGAALVDRDTVLKQGFQEGFERGLQEGRERGLAAGREQGLESVEREARCAQEAMAARLLQLDRLLASMPAELQRVVASADEEIVAFCHSVVCRILGDQLVTREAVAHCVAQALRDAGGGSILHASDERALAVHVHPADLQLLKADPRLEAWLGGGPPSGAARVRWVADERVGVGGCLVRSSEGTLDARLETQLESLRRLLLAARTGEGSSSASALPEEPDGAVIGQQATA